MTFSIRNMVTATGSALALTAQTGALAQVAPTLPPPFVGAPMNVDPRAGQFPLTFDDTGKLVRIGSATIRTKPSGSPVFNLTTAVGPSAQGNAQAFIAPRGLVGNGYLAFNLTTAVGPSAQANAQASIAPRELVGNPNAGASRISDSTLKR